MNNIVVDWIATGMLLGENKERELRKIYQDGFELKRIVKQKTKGLESAKVQLEQKEITQAAFTNIKLDLYRSEQKLNDFIYNKLPGKEKEIILTVKGLVNQLNDIIKLNEKLKCNLKRPVKPQQKKKGLI
jgi:hypothetical protein